MRRRFLNFGDVTPWGVYTAYDQASAEAIMDGGAERIASEYIWAWMKGRLQWTPSEVEACKTFGSDRYCSDAMLRDQEREEAEERAWRAEMGPAFGWKRDSDIAGEYHEAMKRVGVDYDAHLAERRASYRPLLPGEGLSDWARAMGLAARGQYGWTHEQWLLAVQNEYTAHVRPLP